MSALSYVMVIKTEEFVSGSLVVTEWSLEFNIISTHFEVGWPAVMAVTVFGQEWVDVDAFFVIRNILLEVCLPTVYTNQLVLLDVNQDILRQTQMHKSINASLEFFHQFSLLSVIGEVSENEAFLRIRAQSEELQRDLFLQEGISIAIVDHRLDL
jgi:hypothetical protein